ncbi:hypothetical protein IE981_14800 [Klebsiella pneumoniae]|nr:hypothetical protein [Klebsiella pneumoniae]MBD3697613.1 hypothetical protein [Klebsiella pneumoniae]
MNNAGYADMSAPEFTDISPEILTRTFQTNIVGPFLVTQTVVQHIPPGRLDHQHWQLPRFTRTDGRIQFIRDQQSCYHRIHPRPRPRYGDPGDSGQ